MWGDESLTASAIRALRTSPEQAETPHEASTNVSFMLKTKWFFRLLVAVVAVVGRLHTTGSHSLFLIILRPPDTITSYAITTRAFLRLIKFFELA
jgi:hypothetical protein